MAQKSPVETLRKPRRPLLTAALIAATVVALSGVGATAWAIGQAVGEPEASTPESIEGSEPTETPTAAPNEIPTADYVVSSFNGLTITLDASTSTDPDGSLVSYAWNLGDGSTASGSTTEHTFGASGSYSISVTVTDDAGASDDFTADIEVSAPVAPPSGPAYGSYPSGYPMPMVPGTDAPDTSACASSAGYTDSNGVARCL